MKQLFSDAEAYMVRLFNCYAEMQKRPYEYCPGVKLYPSEIHAIECIASMSAVNLTELAKQLGLTKGAVSKSVAKMERLGLVRRYKYVSNQKEVYLHLTELGVKAYEGHKAYHEAMADAMERYCRGISEEKGHEILHFLEMYLSEMKKLNGSRDHSSC